MKKGMAALFTIGLILCLCAQAFAAGPALTIEAAVEQFLQSAMASQAESASDGWQKYVYSSGASSITMPLEDFDISKGKPLSVSFMLTSGNPRIKEQPKYSGDAQAWLDGIMQSMKTPDTKAKLNLNIANVSGGYAVTFAPKAEAALQKAVNTAAAAAKKAFTDKKILAALTDYFLPSPIAVPKKAPAFLNAGGFQQPYLRYLDRIEAGGTSRLLLPAFLYAVKECKLDASGGPEALTLSFGVPDLFGMITSAASDVQYEMRYDQKAKVYTREELESILAASVAQKAIAFRHGKDQGTNESYMFNLFDLDREKDALALTLSYQDTGLLESALENAVSATEDSILDLPDYPAVKNQKSGLVSGRNAGTKCIFNMPKDGLNYCISVYSASSDEQILAAYSNNGSRVSVRIPQGNVYFVIGEGETWYGPKYLFGETGAYMKTETIDILSNRYYHTFTVKPNDGGNTDTYTLNFNDLP